MCQLICKHFPTNENIPFKVMCYISENQKLFKLARDDRGFITEHYIFQHCTVSFTYVQNVMVAGSF